MSAVKSGHERTGRNRSLNEVLFLFLRVHMVSLSIDDGRVCVRGVLCSFGLVCEIRPCEQTNPKCFLRKKYSIFESCYSRDLQPPLLPLCLARYRPRTIIRHKVMKTTTATTPPIKAWSGPCCPKAFGSKNKRETEVQRTAEMVLTPARCYVAE